MIHRLLIQVDGFLYAKLFAIFISILVEFEDHRIALKMIFMPFFVFDGSLPDLTIFMSTRCGPKSARRTSKQLLFVGRNLF